MALNTYNPTIQRKPVLGISLWLPQKGGAEITDPVILTSTEVTELTTDTSDQYEGTGFDLSLGNADTVDLSIAFSGYDSTGHPGVSNPSPVYTHSIAGTNVIGLEVVPVTTPPGITGIFLLASFNGGTTQLVDWKPVQAGRTLTFRQPTVDAPNWNLFNDNAITLSAASSFDFPAIIDAPSIETMSRLTDREIFNGQNVTDSRGSSVRLTGEVAPPDIRFLQSVIGGGDYATDSQGVIHGGTGFVKGFCTPNLWVNYFEAANTCGKLQTNLMLATFAVDTTTVAKDTNNLPFTLTQQDSSYIKGVRPVTWCIV